MDAILYTSNTGTTEQYARLLGEKIGLPVYSLRESSIPKGSNIIYLGWVMASGVKGYKKAAKKYNIKALCGVCMAKSGSQVEEIKKANYVPENIPVFTFQGGFDIEKLHGIYKFMMQFMKRVAGKGLSEKPDKTPEEEEMLDLMLNGKNLVNEDNLKPLLDIISTL